MKPRWQGHDLMAPLPLNRKEFADFFRAQPETGMDYWIVTTILKDGRYFPQTVVTGGFITSVKGHVEIPFSVDEIAKFEITHDKRGI
jgi:hypothetical protein